MARPLLSLLSRPYLIQWFISGMCTIWLLEERLVDVKVCAGPSMYPTLPNNPHRGLILRHYRLGRGVQVGDVIIYNSPINPYISAGKRVIGMPGDYVCADGKYSTGVGQEGTMVRVPEGHVWTVGDNLPWSRDSRLYGPVPMGLIKGKFVASAEGLAWTRVKGGKVALRRVEEGETP